MLKWQASFHGFIAKSREKRPADKGKQQKQQVQSITTRDRKHAAARETTMNNASQGQNPKNTTKAKRGRD
jgi:hypothetical protein